MPGSQPRLLTVVLTFQNWEKMNLFNLLWPHTQKLSMEISVEDFPLDGIANINGLNILKNTIWRYVTPVVYMHLI